MLYKKTEDYTLYQGKMEEELKNFDSNSIDSIVTDPPYELNFMNKGWDNSGIAFQKSTWEQCFRVLKPGGYLLAFGGSRTFHRIAVAIEDAGFEIRDTIMWLYGSGFPKSLNLSKSIESKLVNGNASNTKWKHLDGTKVESGNWGLNKNGFDYGYRPADYSEDKHLRVDKVNYQTEEGKKWDGWGTCLKPAYEPIIVARKPCEGSVTDNVLEYGVGGINIDECRVPLEDGYELKTTDRQPKSGAVFNTETSGYDNSENHIASADPKGRFPANIITDGSEEVAEGMPYTKSTGGSGESSIKSGLSGNVYQGGWNHTVAGDNIGGLGDEGSAMRYFYCAKASKKDRDEGLAGFNEVKTSVMALNDNIDERGDFTGMIRGRNTSYRNIHPTVKPTELMQYLVRLVSPKGATVLDPFMGSGSTGKAVMIENRERNANYKFIGVELTEDYLPICEARIEFGKGYIVDTPIIKSDDSGETTVKVRKVDLF